MSDQELTNKENTSIASEMVSVPKDKLALLIQQNKQAKDDKAQLLEMLDCSVDIIDFMKQNFLGGYDPSELNIPKFIKIISKLPMKLNKLSDADKDRLSKNFELIRNVASKYLDETQVKKISTQVKQISS